MLGRPEEALRAAEEAVTLRRSMAADRAGAGGPLASALISLSLRLAKCSRRRDALEALEEAVTLYRGLAATGSGDFDLDLAMALNNRSYYLAEAGRYQEALTTIREAVRLYRARLPYQTMPVASHYAKANQTLGMTLQRLGFHKEVVCAMAEALRTIVPFAQTTPADFVDSLVEILRLYVTSVEADGVEGDADMLASIAEIMSSYQGFTGVTIIKAR
jgi:tetratricopeptide (TPR) repeat protein